ncbi:MAG: hypothetical protein C4318_04450 [Acidimicrobiia bacterium]
MAAFQSSILRVAVLGNMAGTGYLFTRTLRNYGARADLFLPQDEEDSIPAFAPNVRPPAGSDWVIRFDPSGMGGGAGLFARRSEKALLKRLASEYHVVFSIGLYASLAPGTGKPYVHLALPGDLKSLGYDEGSQGKAYRKALEGAAAVLHTQPEHATILHNMGISHNRFLPFPIQVAPTRPALRPANPVLRIFYPARVDWAEFERDRLIKSGDRLFRACARLLSEGIKLELVLVYRGRESEATVRVIEKLGLASQVNWLPHLDRLELARQFLEADLVVDDFDSPGLGTIALEAMAAGRPVLGYVDLGAAEVAYGEQPPILCARSEQEIYAAIRYSLDANLREQVAAAAHYWVYNHHREEAVGEKLFAMLASAASARAGA